LPSSKGGELGDRADPDGRAGAVGSQSARCGAGEDAVRHSVRHAGFARSRGGIPLVEGGKVVGAIGCSGGTGSQDEVVCKSGAEVIK